MVISFIFIAFLNMKVPTVTASITGYNYQTNTGAFDETDTPADTGLDALGPITTDWGKINLNPGYYTFSAIYLGTTPTWGNGNYFGPHFAGLWNWNGTSTVGALFGNTFGNWYLLRNDSNVAIYQRASTVSIWDPDDLIGFQRITILKHDPYWHLDLWLDFSDSKFESGQVTPSVFDPPGGWVTITSGVSQEYSMAYHYANNLTWAIGAVGTGIATMYPGANAYSYWDHSVSNYSEKNGLKFHCHTTYMVAETVDEIKDLARNIDGTWSIREEMTDYNILIAKNGDKFDSMRFFPASGYSFIPSGTTETIIATNTESTVTYSANPVVNYQKVPFITLVADNNVGYPPNNATGAWIQQTARSYNIAMTMASYFWIAPLEAGKAYVNLSKSEDGVLFEIAGHGWGHYSLFANQTYAYQRFIWDNTTANWTAWSALVPGGPNLYTEMAVGSAFSYQTFHALADAGAKNFIGSQHVAEWLPPQDTNLSLFLMNYHYPYAYDSGLSPMAEILGRAKSYGYYQVNGHPTDFYGASNKATATAYYSWMENNTIGNNATASLIPATVSQFSDLWHTRIVCTKSSSEITIDLATTQANHKIYLDTTNTGMTWYDSAGGEVSLTSEGGAIYSFIGESGHTYTTTYSQSVHNLGVVVGLMMTLAVIVPVIATIAQIANEKRKVRQEDIINMAIFIVVGATLLTLIYALLP